MSLNFETNLTNIQQLASNKEKENDDFISYLKSFDGEYIDKQVHLLNEIVSPKIDCTLCGNCCKTLLINVQEIEANNLAAHLEINRAIFDEQFIEKGSNGMMLIKTVPCSFLKDNKCTVYNFRFEGCKEFPAMHLPNFKDRLFTTFMHYNRCPIIYNIIEQLKLVLNFKE